TRARCATRDSLAVSSDAHRKSGAEPRADRRLTAAAGAAAAAPAARSGWPSRAARREPTHRDRRQELHRVVVALRAAARSRGLGHRPVQLERVAAGAAAVLITGHSP